MLGHNYRNFEMEDNSLFDPRRDWVKQLRDAHCKARIHCE